MKRITLLLCALLISGMIHAQQCTIILKDSTVIQTEDITATTANSLMYQGGSVEWSAVDRIVFPERNDKRFKALYEELNVMVPIEFSDTRELRHINPVIDQSDDMDVSDRWLRLKIFKFQKQRSAGIALEILGYLFAGVATLAEGSNPFFTGAIVVSVIGKIMQMDAGRHLRENKNP